MGVGARPRGEEQRMKTESKRLSPHCSHLDANVEILEDTDNYLYNIDERIKTQNKVGSGQGCPVRFGPQFTGGCKRWTLAELPKVPKALQ